MNLLNGRILALVSAVALLLVAGKLASTRPASASGPTNQFQYPMVIGVDGSSMSSAARNLTREETYYASAQRVTWLMASSEVYSDALMTFEGANSKYVGISGQYCKDKSGNDVFMATRAPADSSLSC